ncbi:MAG: class I SAM-dependent methyltransferase [Rhizomicrobium sp.]|jgi:predicted O-methyltransferase YrrM
MLNRFDISDEALAYTAARYSRPKWAAGTISRDDAAFIFDMLIREHPRSVAEIGVASGTSTAFLSTVLSDRLRDSRLYSFDQLECLYDVPSKPVGAYLYDLFGELPENLTLGAGIASTKIRGWPGRPQQFDFVFLDASHIHPWPCIDLLAIIDIVNPGSWVVLHDVWLPLLSRDTREYGPMYLYQNWPGEKCAPVGNNANIGAVRLFENPADSAAALIDCCRIPWQKHLPFSVWTGCLQALSQVDIDGRESLRAILERPPVAKHPLLRNCEVLIRGTNPWSHFAADLISDKMILHANHRGDPVMSITIRGLKRSECNGIVFPYIVRSDDASSPITLTLALRPSGTVHEFSRTLLLADNTNHFAFLAPPDGFDGFFDAEISVSLAEETEELHGAWVKFEAVHFV